jgi:anti-sigma B factor antagonist
MPSVEGGPAEFSVQARQDHSVRVINVQGELDVSTVPMLQPAFEAALAVGGPVVVDLCGASFMDSAGLHALLVFRQRLREGGRELAIACWPDGAVALSFGVSGTAALFGLRASREDAVASVRQAPSPDALRRLTRAGEGLLATAARRLRR